MTSFTFPRRTGVLLFWHLSENGGFGKVLIPSSKELFFLHRKLIVSGDPIPGATVTFTPTPPLEGKVHPRASDAVIHNPQVARNMSGKAVAR